MPHETQTISCCLAAVAPVAVYMSGFLVQCLRVAFLHLEFVFSRGRAGVRYLCHVSTEWWLGLGVACAALAGGMGPFSW